MLVGGRLGPHPGPLRRAERGRWNGCVGGEHGGLLWHGPGGGERSRPRHVLRLERFDAAGFAGVGEGVGDGVGLGVAEAVGDGSGVAVGDGAVSVGASLSICDSNRVRVAPRAALS